VVKMLLDRADVNPDQADTQYGGTPLWWAARNGHEGVVKMLLQRADVNPNQTDTKYGQTPLWWALSIGHEEVARILQQQGNISSDTTDPGGQASLPPSTRDEGEPPAEIQLPTDDPTTDIADLPLVDPDEKDGTPDINHFIPTSIDNDLSTEPSTPPQHPSTRPLKSLHPPSKSDTHPNTRPTHLLALDRYIIIASLICLFAILIYLLPFSSLDLFPFYR